MKATLSLPQTGSAPAFDARAFRAMAARALRKSLTVLFSEDVSLMVAVLCAVAMWWHIATIPGGIPMQEAIATDCLLALPWGAVVAIRSTIRAFRDIRKGGAI